MKFPNKAIPYKNSVLYTLPFALQVLEKGDCTPQELYEKLFKYFSNIGQFTNCITCLFALGAVELTESGVLHYVKRN